MSGILVLAEHSGGSFLATASELIGVASRLGGPVHAAVLGNAPAASLGGFGASQVWVAPGDFSTYDTGAVADALSAIIRQVDPDIVLAPSTYAGRDALPRVAARFGASMAADCMALRLEGGHLVGRKPMFAGRVEADVTVTSRPAFASVRPNSFPRPESSGGSAPVTEVAWQATTPTATVVETLAPARTGIDLSSADRVVSGGRSLKTKENFDTVIRALAESMGAAVGASRAATDAGLAPHSEQVGQTGQTVSPSLYIAVGISGAIQHVAGMRGSKVIVAINKDPDAPIFQLASYGIVDDLFEICPRLQREFEAM